MLFAFDFDGVIADSFDYNIGLMNRVAIELGLTELFCRATVSACDVMTWERVGAQCGVPESLSGLFCDRLFSLLRNVQPPVAVFDGMAEVLSVAKELGRVVVVTSNFESLVTDVLRRNELMDRVERVFGVETSKDKTEKLQMAAAFAGVSCRKTVKIGDCVSDIQHARRAGTQVIAVSWGFHGRAQLVAAAPDAVADSPAELKRLIRSSL